MRTDRCLTFRVVREFRGSKSESYDYDYESNQIRRTLIATDNKVGWGVGAPSNGQSTEAEADCGLIWPRPRAGLMDACSLGRGFLLERAFSHAI